MWCCATTWGKVEAKVSTGSIVVKWCIWRLLIAPCNEFTYTCPRQQKKSWSCSISLCLTAKHTHGLSGCNIVLAKCLTLLDSKACSWLIWLQYRACQVSHFAWQQSILMAYLVAISCLPSVSLCLTAKHTHGLSGCNIVLAKCLTLLERVAYSWLIWLQYRACQVSQFAWKDSILVADLVAISCLPSVSICLKG